MEVSLAVLSDYANVTGDGKLNIMGLFGEINPPVLPFSLPTMFLALALTASPYRGRPGERASRDPASRRQGTFEIGTANGRSAAKVRRREVDHSIRGWIEWRAVRRCR